MKTQNNGKKTAVIAAAGVGAVALLGAGALALFSDVADTATGGTAGTVSVAVVNPDLQNKSNINPGDNDANMWASLYKNDERHYIPTSEDPLFMPNASHDVDDYSSYVTVSTTPHDLTFTVANTGTKSIRTRQTFIISVYQVEKDDEGKTSANFLPANVFSLYEDGTYYGTKNQDILNVKDSTDYKSSTTTNKFVEEYKAALAGSSDDDTKKVNAYAESVADGLTQPWEEIAYKYYIDEDDNEYLVAVPNSDMSFVKVGDMPTADDIEEIPFGTLIKAVKYVVYSDIFDGVTDNNDELEAEMEGAYGELSNLGDENGTTNVSVIPDAYHVMSSLYCDYKVIGAEKVYYKDQNGNTQYATADGTQFFYFNEAKNLLIAGQDCTVNNVEVKEGEYVVGVDASAYIAEQAMFPVELNTEIDKDGNIVFTDSAVDENGKPLANSVRVPLVHAYNAKEYTYMLGMAKEATNKYQGASVTVDIIVEAMQYRNTNGLADWEAISTNTITTALDFTDNKDTHTSITVPDKEEEPMHKDELTSDGNETDDAIEGDAYVGTEEITRPEDEMESSSN
jgi:hypothetical protein